MTRGLERWYGGHDLHFITCSCYRRRPELGIGERRDLFLRVLERARQKYRFVVIGYVVMPVKRRLAEKPEEWKWSSFRTYACGEEGLVRVNCEEWPLKITYSAPQTHLFETRE